MVSSFTEKKMIKTSSPRWSFLQEAAKKGETYYIYMTEKDDNLII